MPARININANMLSWAISRAGYDEHEFLINNPKVKGWMDGETKPTLRQLESFAKQTHAPFGFLMLQEPPEEPTPIPFFRTGQASPTSVSLNVYDTIITLQNRQEWLRNYLIEEHNEPLGFVGKFEGVDNVEIIVNDIRRTLGLSETWAMDFPNWENALNYLTERIESIGVIISFNGVVGNNTHRLIPVEECRGFVLVDEYCPFMFINSADSKSAQMFTIVHELAHIWVGKSAGFDFNRMHPADNEIEILCDKVAAEFLVPAESFITVFNENRDFKSISRFFKVSPIVVMRRALDLDLISKAQFFKLYNNYMKDFAFKRSKLKEKPGGNFFATAKKRVSPTFAAYINHAVLSNKLLYRDATKLTGLKASTYEKLLNEYL